MLRKMRVVGYFAAQSLFGTTCCLSRYWLKMRISDDLSATPRDGVPRPVAKLIVSEIGGDAQALGAATVPFKSELF